MRLILLIAIAIFFFAKSATFNRLIRFSYELKDGFSDFLIFLSYYRKAKFFFKGFKFTKYKNVLLLIIIVAISFYLFSMSKRKQLLYKNSYKEVV